MGWRRRSWRKELRALEEKTKRVSEDEGDAIALVSLKKTILLRLILKVLICFIFM